MGWGCGVVGRGVVGLWGCGVGWGRGVGWGCGVVGSWGRGVVGSWGCGVVASWVVSGLGFASAVWRPDHEGKSS